MSHLSAGVDLGGTKIQAAIIDGKHAVRGKARVATPTAGGPDAIVEAIVSAVREAADAADVEVAHLGGIGIGAPGAVDAERGVLAQAPNLAGWDAPYPLAQHVEAACGCKVRLGNDVTMAVLGERELGAGSQLQSFAGIWWGTGVGGGIVLDRELWHGRGAAGEVGHMVVRLGGLAEPNGLIGTLEAYAGRRNMEARARAAVAGGRSTLLFDLMAAKGKSQLSSSVWQQALESGDGLAVELIDDAVEALAAAAANLVNVLDLEAIIVGGGLGSRLGQPLADRIARATQPHLFQPALPPRFIVAELGDLGGAIGASLLITEHHGDR